MAYIVHICIVYTVYIHIHHIYKYVDKYTAYIQYILNTENTHIGVKKWMHGRMEGWKNR